MEIVLLWLDDLDDLVFSSALLWERLRRACLQVGLVASFALAACELSVSAAIWAPQLAGIALSSVSIWCSSAVFMFFRRLELGRTQTLA